MTYSEKELSVFDSEPIELYTFQFSGGTWRYNNSDSDVISGGQNFTSLNIKRLAIEENQDRSRAPQTIVMPGDTAFVVPYRASPPNGVVQLILQRYHRDDSEVRIIWQGRVVNVKFMNDGVEAEVRCEPVFTSLVRPALRRLYQRACSHVLYGTECKVVRTIFETNATLQSVSGNIISSGTFALQVDGFYNGGYVEWSQSGITQRRFIISHTSDAITVSLPFDGIPGNATVKLYPGCDHTLNHCINKFNNVDNYGGQPFFPNKNPMGGSPVF
jgi:uncharacterized phage protein (TIGR02218 family)